MLPAPGMTATPDLPGVGSLGENHPQPCTKSEHEQDNRSSSSSQPPFWALPFCLSNFARDADINASVAGRHFSGMVATESPPLGTRHLMSPCCPKAVAALAWSGAQPAVVQRYQHWAHHPCGVVPCPVMAHSCIRYTMPHLFSIPTGSLPCSPTLPLPHRLCWGYSSALPHCCPFLACFLST